MDATLKKPEPEDFVWTGDILLQKEGSGSLVLDVQVDVLSFN